jgi:transcriptional regulator with XRE-family HTH domain
MPHAIARKGKVGKKLPALDVMAPTRWSVAERIRYALAKRGEDPNVHEALGVSARTLARYKAGETSPDGAFLAALAQVSGVGEDWLRAGGDFPFIHPPEDAQIVVRVPVDSLVELVRAAAPDLPEEARRTIAEAVGMRSRK